MIVQLRRTPPSHLAWNEKDLQALMALYDEEALLTSPTGERVTGRENIEKYFETSMKESSNFTINDPTTDHSGKLMQDGGSFQYTITRMPVLKSGPGTILKIGPGVNFKVGPVSFPVKGNYVMGLKRESKGKLLIAEHIWNQIPAK